MKKPQPQSPPPSGLEIAVIGMAGRFPGAADVTAFWQNLEQGVESISFYSDDDLKSAGVDAALLGNPSYVKGGGALADKDLFDPHFFGYIPAEARMMDPQMRVFHEVVWEALEDAGHDPGRFKGLVGLYAGAAHSFGWEAMVKLSGATGEYGQFEVGQLTDKDFMCTRISYKLRLHGPSVAVQSACSTSLVAIHLACRALLTGECGMAIAGGVTILSSQNAGYLFQEGMTLSPDGHCRAFDAGANGTVSGEGAGAVVLRRLKDAEAGRDHIYAVVRGSAVNNDGAGKVGYTAPSVEGQAQVIRKAMRLAKVEAEDIGFIEAHGTGTTLGDPVEVEALDLAFGTDKRQYCALGSVKTNVGHLNSAAGVTGFIKAALSVYHRSIPPSLHYKAPNPTINFSACPFYVNTELRHWQQGDGPLIGGVSSFGIGGTNAHVILQEPPVRRKPQTAETDHTHLFLLSAPNHEGLEALGSRMERFFHDHSDLEAADVAFTLANGRRHFSRRRAIVCSGTQEARDILGRHRLNQERIPASAIGEGNRSPIFLFPGLGAHYPAMARRLYAAEPIFRREMDTCLEIVEELGLRGIKAGYANSGDSDWPLEFEDQKKGQALLFCVSFSLARLLIHWGVTPTAMMGYSFGEYTAAAVSGVLTPRQALTLILSRADCFSAIPEGKMLSVPLPLAEVEPLLSGSLCPAIDNGPSVIVSGTTVDIDALAADLRERRLMCMEVPNPYPLHCPLVDPALELWRRKAGDIVGTKPQIPYISNMSGAWITEADAADPQYWGRHLRHTVKFAAGVETLLELDNPLFIEVGPGRDLCALVQRFQEEGSGITALSTLRPLEIQTHDRTYLLRAMGRMWRAGVTIDWEAFWKERPGNRVSLPTYPFQRQRYWIDRKELEAHWNQLTGGAALSGKKDLSRWFYLPQWARMQEPPPQTPKPGNEILWALCLRSDKTDSLTHALLDQLESAGHQVIQFPPPQDQTAVNGFEKLGREIAKRGAARCNIIYPSDPGAGIYADYFHLTALARALADGCPDTNITIAVLTRNLHKVTGEERLRLEQASLLGPVKVIPREYPFIDCCNIDLSETSDGSPDDAQLARRVLARCLDRLTEPVIALRGGYSWRQIHEPFVIEEGDCREWLQPGGVVLLTGGLGGIGLNVALHLAKRYQARLALTGTREMPAQGEMPDRLRRIQEAGAEAVYQVCDVSDPTAMKAAVKRTVDCYGTLNGIIHIAGVADYEGVIQKRTTPDGSLAVLDPKVKGVLSIQKALEGAEPDFVVLFSSVASVLAPFGQVAYTAGNAYMDAVAGGFGNGKTRWVSVAWDVWRNTGMAAEAQTGDGGMPPELALEALERLMRSPYRFPAATVFSHDLQAHLHHLDQVVDERRRERQEGETHAPSPDTKRERPDLSAAYMAPETEAEQTMVSVWEHFFGVAPIGVEDDFFELGGDSLKAMTLAARVHKAMNAKIPLAQFFKTFTIRGLCRFIDQSDDEEFFSIEPAPIQEYYPLSSAQKRLFILQHMEPRSVAYNMPTVLSLDNAVDREQWRETFGRMIQRHEIFRTSFHLSAGMPQQKIHQTVAFQLESYEGQESSTIVKEFVRPFKLDEPPLLRAGLANPTGGGCLLLVDMHHIISDLVTVERFMTEFTALLEGRELPPVTVQYKDYAQWQHSPPVRELLKGQQEFWLETFSSMPPLLELPVDFPRPPVQSFAGASRSLTFDRELTARLETLAAELDVTMFMLALGLMTVWLSQLSGAEDIVVGTPVSARRHADLEDCMGLLVNMLALRNCPAGTLAFADFLANVKNGALAAFEHQDYPFEDLVERLKIPRNMGRNPLCDVVLVYQEAMDQGDGNLTMRNHNQEHTVSKFDLTLTIIKLETRLFLRLEYCTDLFEADTIDRFINYFENLTRSVLEDPSRMLAEIDMLPEKERQELLARLNDEPGDYPQHETIVSLFRRQSATHADRVAVLEPDRGQVTYGELERRALVLAASLRDQGVAEESIVALLMEPSAAMIAAVLGVLLAGCAYLPVDPHLPEARIRFILDDSQSPLTIDSSFLEHAPWDEASPAQEVALPEISPRQCAYVIYTSGTTGRPKGVMVQHHNVVQLMVGAGFPFDFGVDDTWTMFHSYSFDFSVWEMYGALLYGGRLVTVPPLLARDPAAFQGALTRFGVTVLNQTPSAFYTLARRMIETGCRHSLRWIVFGGEALAPGRLAEFHNTWKEVRLVNMFGITETTVHVTFRPIGEREIQSGASDIGTPLQTLNTMIANRSGRLTPWGSAGELWVGGAGVARGYLNRPELTAEKFVPCPYNGVGRMYRSGDLVRLKKDGNMEYLGRVDQQVKIRGYRIELAEIEAKLSACEAVTEAAAVARPIGNGQQGIAAYIQLAPGGSLETVHESLRRQLPAYMVPAHLVTIDKLPLTPNRKIDRRALMNIPITRTPSATGGTGIKNRIQRLLADIWREVAAVDDVRPEDNFFDIGGNSLSIIQVGRRIKEELEVDVPVMALFEHPTIQSLANYVQNKNNGTKNNQNAAPVDKREAKKIAGKTRRLQQEKRRKGRIKN